MNKKQILFSFLAFLIFCSLYAYAVFMIPRPQEAFRFMLIPTVAILVAGFGLIYIFRDRKSNPKH
ncbi:MAG: hypothetical protein AB1530_04160 [Candidatus Omnitrophota bacterium]